MKKTVLRYLISSVDTFLSVFVVTALAVVESGVVSDLASLKTVLLAASVAGLTAGLRAVLKAIREHWKGYVDSQMKN